MPMMGRLCYLMKTSLWQWDLKTGAEGIGKIEIYEIVYNVVFEES